MNYLVSDELPKLSEKLNNYAKEDISNGSEFWFFIKYLQEMLLLWPNFKNEKKRSTFRLMEYKNTDITNF